MAKPKIQNPGENLPPEDDHEAGDGQTDGQAAGNVTASADDAGALKAQIEALQRENALLKAAQGAKTPSVVYEPTTTHGAAEIAASKHRHITAAEFAALIDEGKASEPPPNNKVLCSDGWYVSRRPEPVK